MTDEVEQEPVDFIREYWDSQATRHGAAAEASWGDIYMVDLEVDLVARHIPAGGEVLDVGCANGHATLQQRGRGARRIVGVDFSSRMVAEARAELAANPQSGCEVTFEQADVRSLPFADDSFDLVYTTRVLINLSTWEQQKQGIAECLRVCRREGAVLLCEGFWEPLVLLNAMRTLVALPPLAEHDFNRYLKKSRLEEHLNGLGVPFQVHDFSSVYYLGSRFLRELVTDPSAWPGYTNPINGIFHRIEQEYSGGGFGIQQGYALTKP